MANTTTAQTNDSKFTDAWLPIKQIMNGMIQLDSGIYVTGIKISPKNIFIMDRQAQDNMIYNLKNFYNTIDYEFWLIIADRPVDINLYLAELQRMYNNSTSNEIRKIIMQDINKANKFMNVEYNVVDTEYYIIFQEKKLEILQKKLHNLIAGLANCNMQASQTSNDDLRIILDNLLNGGETINFGTVMY
jgi:hypothetical protein